MATTDTPALQSAIRGIDTQRHIVDDRLATHTLATPERETLERTLAQLTVDRNAYQQQLDVSDRHNQRILMAGIQTEHDRDQACVVWVIVGIGLVCITALAIWGR